MDKMKRKVISWSAEKCFKCNSPSKGKPMYHQEHDDGYVVYSYYVCGKCKK